MVFIEPKAEKIDGGRSMPKALLIGGPGNISYSTIQVLLRRGYEIAIFTLPISVDIKMCGDVTFFTGDRNDKDALSHVFKGFKPDVIIDFVCFEPEQAQMLADIASGKIGQYVYVSTCDVYGYPLSRIPMREDDAWTPPVSEYARKKRTAEDLLKTRYNPQDIPLTIIRPSYSMGNHFVISAFSREGGRQLVYRLKNGLPVISPGDGTTLLHPGSAHDTGRMIAQTVGSALSLQNSYTCAGNDSYRTYDNYIMMFAKILNVNANIVHIPTDLMNTLDMPEMKDTLLNELTKYHVAFSVDRFKRDFPDFKWEKRAEDATTEFIENLKENDNDERICMNSLEHRVLERWEKAIHVFQ